MAKRTTKNGNGAVSLDELRAQERQQVEKELAAATVEGGRFSELGVTGLKRTADKGQVIEEFLKDLLNERALRVYREMRDNDAVVGAILFAIEMLIRTVTWRVEGDDDETNKFVDSCRDDMSHSWSDFIAEVLSMLPYGFSYHEIVYKKRSGPSVSDPGSGSKHNDGKIGWRKLPIRAQDTLTEWHWDEEGGVQGVLQEAAPKYQSKFIPINRSLLFRVGVHKGNPEGRSVLRNAFRPWYFLRRLQEIEAIGIERDLAGLPVIYRTAEVAEAYDAELKKILRNVRRDEQEGLLLPLILDEKGNKLLEFTLMASAGSRQMEVSKPIERYEKSIANTVLADFILLGQTAVGSFALSSDKTALFSIALGAVLDAIASVLNTHAIPRLCALNGIPAEKFPKITHSDLETPDLTELGDYITKLAGAGMPLFPDDELEGYLRRTGNLPQKPEEGLPQPVPKGTQLIEPGEEEEEQQQQEVPVKPAAPVGNKKPPVPAKKGKKPKEGVVANAKPGK